MLIAANFEIEDLMFMVVIGVIVLVAIAAICFVMIKVVKGKDASLPLRRAKIKVLEKPENLNTNTVYWVTIEFEDGTRDKKRVFPGDSKILLTVGDEGIIEFQGKTIKAFTKES